MRNCVYFFRQNCVCHFIKNCVYFLGSGFSVHIGLKESNLAPLFKAIDHSENNDNDGFYGDSSITDRYCPHPVPEKYQMSMVMHRVNIKIIYLIFIHFILQLCIFTG